MLATELSPTGNGYICESYLPEYKNMVDDRGWISIKDLTEKELRNMIEKVIQSFK